MAKTLNAIHAELPQCRRCSLYRNATQAVGGEGTGVAHLMLVGEQPGDKEDLAGQPFVGPAGGLLDAALSDAGVKRKAVYVTNAVKHFKYEPRGKRRLHKRPNAAEIEACRWWLEQEIEVIRPRAIVALGATAAQSLLRHPVRIGESRGAPIPLAEDMAVFVTVHPASLLRQRDSAQRKLGYEQFVRDLQLAAKYSLQRQRRGGIQVKARQA